MRLVGHGADGVARTVRIVRRCNVGGWGRLEFECGCGPWSRRMHARCKRPGTRAESAEVSLSTQPASAHCIWAEDAPAKKKDAAPHSAGARFGHPIFDFQRSASLERASRQTVTLPPPLQAQLRTPPAEPTSERRHRPLAAVLHWLGVKHAGPPRFVRSATRTRCPPRVAKAACKAPATSPNHIYPKSSSRFVPRTHHRNRLHHGDCKG